MDQTVPKCDDPCDFADLFLEVRESTNGLAGCFTNDQELPFDGTP
jgi:hypothetical protein